MREVKRYDFVGGDGPGAYPVEDINGRMVSYEDFDAERLRAETAVAEVAALREELAVLVDDNMFQQTNSQRLQRELTAAEQRNAELVELLKRVQPCISAHTNGTKSPLRAEIDAALKPTESESDECTSCDGSGEYVDAIGDWRGYCSCPAGVALKNKPTESGASE